MEQERKGKDSVPFTEHPVPLVQLQHAATASLLPGPGILHAPRSPTSVHTACTCGAAGAQAYLWAMVTAVGGLSQLSAAHVTFQLFLTEGLVIPGHQSLGTALSRRGCRSLARLLLIQLFLALLEVQIQCLQLAAEACALRSEPLQLRGLTRGA